ncbi:MAG: hypothetical protein ACRDU8_10705 [Egibacteraceae bacterium]
MTTPASTPPGLAPDRRWRCGACGNLTRFDVETTERIRRFWHVDLAGQGRAEEETAVAVAVESVTCRWCGSSDDIEVVDAPGAPPTSPP